MANERPHWPFRPAPNGRRPPETGSQLELLQRVSNMHSYIHSDKIGEITFPSHLNKKYTYRCVQSYNILNKD